jgi:hypothetical protein
MLDTLSRALVWADSHGLTVPVILGALTVLARLVWAALRPSVLRRWPGAVPVVEGAAVRVAALLPDVLAAILRRRPAAPSGRSGEAGRATVGALVLLALVGALGLAACPRAREAVLDTQSPRVACAADTQRCHDGAPEVCSRAGRWWPAMPPHDDGTRRRCADVCEVSAAGIAHCASSQVVTP